MRSQRERSRARKAAERGGRRHPAHLYAQMVRAAAKPQSRQRHWNVVRESIKDHEHSSGLLGTLIPFSACPGPLSHQCDWPVCARMCVHSYTEEAEEIRVLPSIPTGNSAQECPLSLPWSCSGVFSTRLLAKLLSF